MTADTAADINYDHFANWCGAFDGLEGLKTHRACAGGDVLGLAAKRS